jgi:hypothetical protein
MDKNKVPSLIELCKVLDTDYYDYGGKISRWADSDADYNDCSCGCMYFIPLYNEKNQGPDFDFGICTNAKSKRCGLLTYEHQAGYGCFTLEKLR